MQREKETDRWPNPHLAGLYVGGCMGVCVYLCNLFLSSLFVPPSLPKLKFHGWGLSEVIRSAELNYFFLCLI